MTINNMPNAAPATTTTVTNTLNGDVNVDNSVNLLYINTAEQSFFDTAFGQVVGGALSAIGGEAVSAVLGLIFGNSSPDAAMLQSISNQIATVQGKIAAVPSTTNYYGAVLNVQTQLANIYDVFQNSAPLTNWPASSLNSAQMNTLLTFISTGVSSSYSGYINTLLFDTYGASIANLTGANQSKATWSSMGTNTMCYAYALNNTLLESPTEISAYVGNHMTLASTTAALVLAICVAANQVYEYLSANEAEVCRIAGISNIDLQATLSGAGQISNMQSSAFFPVQLSQQLATAPSILCGEAYTLVVAMANNCSSTATGINTNVLLSNSNGNVVPDDFVFNYWTLKYGSSALYWRIFFANESPTSGLVCLEGYNGGYLGFVPGVEPAYVYEITSTSALATGMYGDSDNASSAPLPTFSTCQWEMTVMANGSEMVYLFQNQSTGKLYLANNHGPLESTQPGQYNYKSGDKDLYWNVTMQY